MSRVLVKTGSNVLRHSKGISIFKKTIATIEGDWPDRAGNCHKVAHINLCRSSMVLAIVLLCAMPDLE